MIPMPDVPTDNLYKFMSIAGLILAVSAAVAPFLTLDEALIKSYLPNVDPLPR